MYRSIGHVMVIRHERIVRKVKGHEGEQNVMVGEQSPHFYKYTLLLHLSGTLSLEIG